jgi:hypothetical protein
MDIEQIGETVEEKSPRGKKPSKTKKKIGREELLLSGILQLPLDKIISILAAQLPENNLPHIEEPLIPTPTDPFQLTSQTHPLEH